MKITITDIAKEAGLPVSTVSYILNKKTPIKSAKHKKVLEIVDKYNYVPNANAKSLITGKSNNVGLIVAGSNAGPMFLRTFLGRCILEIFNVINDSFGWLSICLPNDSEITKIKHYLSNTKVDGIIVMYSALSDDQIKTLKNRGLPYIYFTGKYEDYDNKGCLVSCNDYEGIKMAFNYLVEKGHKKIMFISGHPSKKFADYTEQDARCKAYMHSINEHEFTYMCVLYCDNSQNSAHKIIKEFIDKGKEMPEAIITANEAMAYGVLSALNMKGLKVPEDISLISYDDANTDMNEDYGLTSVREPLGDMLKQAIEHIYECIEEKKQPSDINIEFKPELIIRTSVKERSNGHI